ncbi:MAG: hypothetical protein CM1200mP13_10300 [Candidatus Pelagibacterales bacterium]|nr:MAG: hypothetical protein CM1200mP13_10300 [Pelagibacterales bacterium]
MTGFLKKLDIRIFFRGYGSVLPQVFINKKYWLYQNFSLIFPLATFKLNQNNPIYSKIFLYSGLIGFFYFFLQGFSIGIRGWNFEILQSIFGDVENQFGVGSGAVLTCCTFVFYILMVFQHVGG